MRLKTMAIGACLSVGVCAEAAAQTAVMPEVQPERKIDFGGRVSVVHDSNFARGSKALAASRGIEPDEVVITPSATASIVQTFGRQVVFLDGAVGYDFHKENSQLDRQNYDVNGGVMNITGMCRQSVFGAYSAAQSDLLDLDAQTTKNLLRETSTALGITCGRATGLGFSAVGMRTDRKNSAARAKTQDVTTETLQLGAQYSNSVIGAASLVYIYSNNEFPNRIIPGRPVGDGFYTETYGIQVQRQVGSAISAVVGVGRTHVKREFAPPGVRTKFNSMTYNGELTYDRGRLVLSLSGARSVTPSTRQGKLYDIVTSGQIDASYSIGSRYTLDVGHVITDSKSNPDAALGLLTVTDSEVNTTFASLKYEPRAGFSLTLDLRYQDRETNLPDFNYHATRIGLTAAASF